jgi:hypothetical protein
MLSEIKIIRMPHIFTFIFIEFDSLILQGITQKIWEWKSSKMASMRIFFATGNYISFKSLSMLYPKSKLGFFIVSSDMIHKLHVAK